MEVPLDRESGDKRTEVKSSLEPMGETANRVEEELIKRKNRKNRRGERGTKTEKIVEILVYMQPMQLGLVLKLKVSNQPL